MSMNVKSPSPPFKFFVKKCDPPPGSSKIYSDPPLPPDKHGLWLDCATILGSFTQRLEEQFAEGICLPGKRQQLLLAI